MALGIIVTLAASTHVQKLIPAGMAFPTLAVLNPNDGIVFVATDRDVAGVNTAQWDWKIPSQSYALLPGTPNWHSVGLYYLDQSGAGRQGEITIYPVNSKIALPAFQSIGRALQAQATTLDIVEGVKPANPGVGVLRLWADGTDILHLLDSGGIDAGVIDSLTTLSGDLTGQMPGPLVAARAITNAKIALATIIGANIAPLTIDAANINVNVLPTLLVDYNHAADIWAGAVMAAGAWNAGGPTVSFTTVKSTGVLLILASMGIQCAVSPAGAEHEIRLSLDGGALFRQVESSYIIPANIPFIMHGGAVLLPTASLGAVGAHTVAIQLWAGAATTWYWRCATIPKLEWLRIQVIEL